MNLRTFYPPYFYKRAKWACYQWLHPNDPWLTEDAIKILSSWLKPSDKYFEWGSGRSTLWFLERVAEVASVETDGAWFSKVEGMIKEKRIPGKTADYTLVDLQKPDGVEKYVGVCGKYPDQYFDVILVDGAERLKCIRSAQAKVKSGGLLCLDNANWYVNSRVENISVTVIHDRNCSLDSGWEEIERSLSSWRSIVTSNGITVTKIWIKP